MEKQGMQGNLKGKICVRTPYVLDDGEERMAPGMDNRKRNGLWIMRGECEEALRETMQWCRLGLSGQS